MASVNQSIWNSPQTARLASVLATLNGELEIRAFLSDVMTEKEIIEISARFEAARMLQQGATYQQITKATKLSSRTVARISDWLQNGAGGYSVALSAADHTSHSRPARAA